MVYSSQNSNTKSNTILHTGALVTAHLLYLHGWYYFNRRVPSDLKEYDNRTYVRISLKTDSRKEAIRLSSMQNEHIEAYWAQLISTNQKFNSSNWKSFNRQGRIARFIPSGSEHALQSSGSGIIYPKPTIKTQSGHLTSELSLSQALEKYWRFEKPKTLNKSPNQIRKWENPRKLAIKNLIACIGDIPLQAITREDMLTFREWWLTRMATEELSARTVNKNLVLLKTIVESLNDNLNLSMDTKQLFKRMFLPDDSQEQRLPFTKEFITESLLNPSNLKGLNEQAKWVLHAIAETGAGISEQVGLMPEDIILNHPIPHIIIVPRHKKALKTKYRKRVIPLVGFALDAFKACPEGFTQYRDRPDSLSGVIGSFLREKKLLPSSQHSVYSLRHSFQDRLLAVNAPDRVQADLMGHKFNRPSYGEGASLEQKFDWLEKIKLKHPHS